MHIPVHSSQLPGYIGVPQTILIILTMVGLSPDIQLTEYWIQITTDMIFFLLEEYQNGFKRKKLLLEVIYSLNPSTPSISHSHIDFELEK